MVEFIRPDLVNKNWPKVVNGPGASSIATNEFIQLRKAIKGKY